MNNAPKFKRPVFDEALSAWKALLGQQGLPIGLIWLFDENLCFEKESAGSEVSQPGFQLEFTPPPPGAEQIAYDYFSGFDTRLIFYRLGSSQGKSVCCLLCDDWFEARREADGFIRRDDWLISFRPGAREEIREITDAERWRRRILKNRSLHDLDFCMTLRTVHEILAHGHALSTYERYALKFFHVWWRLLGKG